MYIFRLDLFMNVINNYHIFNGQDVSQDKVFNGLHSDAGQNIVNIIHVNYIHIL